MNSHLLECRLVHHRLRPRENRFTNRIFLLALDLDELGAVAARLRLFSHNRANLFAVRDGDYLPAEAGGVAHRGTRSLRERVGALLARHGHPLEADDRVLLATLPRIAGYSFNPVSFYFVARAGRPHCAVAEVTNTFREVKAFVLRPGTLGPAGEFRLRVPKHFYVSPFSSAGDEFDFRLQCDAGGLAVRIDDYAGGRLALHSVLVGRPRPLTDAALAWCAVRYPFLSLRVMAEIHLQALRLYWKRLPWRRKADEPALQRDFHPAAGARRAAGTT